MADPDLPLPPHPPPPPASSTGPQIRSRITVVCAECKRLKLKCDRRTPCGSCTKRDTVARCVYSPAAAEKVDLHSLNNRLMQVEAILSQLTAGQFTSSYPLSCPPQHIPFVNPMLSTSSLPSAIAAHFPHASIGIPFDVIATNCLGPMHIDFEEPEQAKEFLIKHEAPSTPNSFTSKNVSHRLLPSTEAFFQYPTASSMSQRRSTNLSSINSSTDLSSHSGQPCVTPVLVALLPPVVPIPSSDKAYALSLKYLLHLAERSTAYSYPSIDWKHFQSQAVGLVARFCHTDAPDSKWEEKELNSLRARALFFGEAGSVSGIYVPKQQAGSTSLSLPFFAALCAALAIGAMELRLPGLGQRSETTDVSDMIVDGDADYPQCIPLSNLHPQKLHHSDASFWYALSVQALSIYEASLDTPGSSTDSGSNAYDINYLIACLLQVVFLVKGGGHSSIMEGHESSNDSGSDNPYISQNIAARLVFPLVGKMVNIARQMGLMHDPSDQPPQAPQSSSESTLDSDKKLKQNGLLTFSPFEIEMRRRIWWDVCYFDLFVSDALGHPALIHGDSYTTKIPLCEIDERLSDPTSSRVPSFKPVPGDTATGSFSYFKIKCLMSQLVHSIKKRLNTSETMFSPKFGHGLSSPQLGPVYGIDQAASMEGDIRTWFTELPPTFRFDSEQSIAFQTIDQAALAIQRCEIAITIHRLIMRIYLPFLSASSVSSQPPHQASFGVVNAAHVIIHAASIVNKVWRTHTESQQRFYPSCLFPAMFDFYSLYRTVLDAVIVCAHASLTQPLTLWWKPASEDIDIGFSLLDDADFWRATCGHGVGAHASISRHACLTILASLKIKLAEAKKNPAHFPLKRKYADVDGVVSSTSGQAFTPLKPGLSLTDTSAIAVHPDLPKSQVSPSPSNSVQPAKQGHESEKKRSKPQYPTIGIRVRTAKDHISQTRQNTTSPSHSSPSAYSHRGVSHSPSTSIPNSSRFSTLSVTSESPATPSTFVSGTSASGAGPSPHSTLPRDRCGSVASQANHTLPYGHDIDGQQLSSTLEINKMRDPQHVTTHSQDGSTTSPTVKATGYQNSYQGSPHTHSFQLQSQDVYITPSPYSSTVPHSITESPYATDVGTPVYGSTGQSHQNSPQFFGNQINETPQQPFFAQAYNQSYCDGRDSSFAINAPGFEQLVPSPGTPLFTKPQHNAFDIKPPMDSLQPDPPMRYAAQTNSSLPNNGARDGHGYWHGGMGY